MIFHFNIHRKLSVIRCYIQFFSEPVLIQRILIGFESIEKINLYFRADKDSKDDNLVFIHQDAVQQILDFDSTNLLVAFSS